ncbi:uncharacterized protein METZ01_LOCUS327339, partial [marine metagenome]
MHRHNHKMLHQGSWPMRGKYRTTHWSRKINSHYIWVSPIL